VLGGTLIFFSSLIKNFGTINNLEGTLIIE
jgi:hypothetical protein